MTSSRQAIETLKSHVPPEELKYWEILLRATADEPNSRGRAVAELAVRASEETGIPATTLYIAAAGGPESLATHDNHHVRTLAQIAFVDALAREGASQMAQSA